LHRETRHHEAGSLIVSEGVSLGSVTGWDWFVILVLSGSVLLGLWRGLIRTVFGLAAWVIALVGGPVLNLKARATMCGILGVVSRTPVNQLLYDGLLLLQHRGQDAAGIATSHGQGVRMHKGNGLVRDVFRTRNMRSLPGRTGIGHVRYPTAGSATDSEEAQPFYVNAPFGITLAHNGNLTNSEQLKDEMFRRDRRHINTESDSEVLLNVLANELQAAVGVRSTLTPSSRR
jgi:hypothetical protein